MLVMTLFNQQNGRFYTRGRIIRLDELGKHLLFVWLCIFSINTDTRGIMRQDELSSVVRLTHNGR